MNSFLCPVNNKFEVQGNSYSAVEKVFGISLSKCVGESHCQTTTNIDSILSGVFVEMLMVSTHFDFNNYEDPVKTYIDDRFFYNALSGFV